MSSTGYDMIEKYLDGTLSHEASREFERLIRSDADLARELRSEELIRETLAVDVAALPMAATVPSSLLTAKLAAGAAGSSGAATGVATGVATNAASAGTSGIIGAIFGSGVGLTILGVTGVVGILIGIFLFNEEEKARPQRSPVVDTIERVEPSARPDASIPSNAQASAPPTEGRVIDEEAVTTSRKSVTERTVNARGTRTLGEAKGPDRDPSSPTPSTPQDDDLLNRLKRHDPTPPPVVRNDSAKLRIEVE